MLKTLNTKTPKFREEKVLKKLKSILKDNYSKKVAKSLEYSTY